MLLPSSYNIITEKGDHVLLFNSRSLCFGKVGKELYREAMGVIKKVNDGVTPLEDNEARHLAFILRQKGFFLPDPGGEREMLRRQFRRDKKGDTHIGLTISPTELCNFSCTYCYEEPNNSFMNRDVQDKILDYLDTRLAGGGVKDMHITWYGGEPLLPKSLGAIRAMSENIIKRCDGAGVAFRANLITNGYLLTPALARRLSAWKIELLQITLDGTGAYHDSKRKLLGGGGTFDTIVANIKQCMDIIRITIRMNVDQENQGQITELKHFLKEQGILDGTGRVTLYLSPVRSYTENCGGHSCLSDGDFYQMEVDLLKSGINDRDVSIIQDYPTRKTTVCTAVSKDSFVIGPDGLLYKCWLDLGRPDQAVGKIGKTPELNEKIDKWVSFEPFSKKDCRECKYLPICMGGCPELNIRSGVEISDQACCNWKYCLDQYLQLLAT